MEEEAAAGGMVEVAIERRMGLPIAAAEVTAEETMPVELMIAEVTSARAIPCWTPLVPRACSSAPSSQNWQRLVS